MCTYKIRKLVKVGVLVGVYFSCLCVEADELYTLGSKNNRESDDIVLETYYFNYKNHLRSFYWPYQENTKALWDYGLNVQRAIGEASTLAYSTKSANLSIGWHHSVNDYITGSIGTHYILPESTPIEHSRTSYEFRAHLGDPETGHIYYHFADDYVYQLSLQPAGIKEYLSASRHSLGIRWVPAGLVKLEPVVSQWNLSDDNIRRSAKLDAYLKLSREWVWLGVSYENMGYKEKRADYWSPQSFRSLGLVFESSISLGRKLTTSLAGSLSSIKEDNFPKGRASSLSIGVDYKPLKNLAVRYSFSRYKSQQKTNQWSELSSNVSINGLF